MEWKRAVIATLIAAGWFIGALIILAGYSLVLAFSSRYGLSGSLLLTMAGAVAIAGALAYLHDKRWLFAIPACILIYVTLMTIPGQNCDGRGWLTDNVLTDVKMECDCLGVKRGMPLNHKPLRSECVGVVTRKECFNMSGQHDYVPQIRPMACADRLPNYYG